MSLPTKIQAVWTPEKVSGLISLYEANECLWNYNTEEYKNRMKRDEAIRRICNALQITKEQFAKKIHNLRNQFNFELKKRQKRGSETDTVSYSGKWEYFDRLLFLKKFISHRAGYGGSASFSTVSPTHSEQTNVESESCIQIENTFIKKLEQTSDSHIEESHITEYESQPEDPQQPRESIEMSGMNLIVEEDHEHYVEQHAQSPSKPSNATYGMRMNVATQQTTVEKKRRLSKDGNLVRDECDIFGEFVSNELRNLNSSFLRKKMKRKIMQAIMDVWNEDDEVNINICLN